MTPEQQRNTAHLDGSTRGPKRPESERETPDEFYARMETGPQTVECVDCGLEMPYIPTGRPYDPTATILCDECRATR